MVPLHLRTTTVHVTLAVAEQLVTDGVASWLPDRVGLVATAPLDVAALSLA